jgi:SIT family siderophore-iron:H+ symporter-like MFS transporter
VRCRCLDYFARIARLIVLAFEDLAVITATYLVRSTVSLTILSKRANPADMFPPNRQSSYSLGSSLGNAASGALWTQVLPRKLEASLGDATLAASVYNDPFTFIAANPMGTAPRKAVVVAYRAYAFTVPLFPSFSSKNRPRLTPSPPPFWTSVLVEQTQRLLCITGICLAVPLVLCAVLVRDVRMGDGQNIAELAEREKNEAR